MLLKCVEEAARQAKEKEESSLQTKGTGWCLGHSITKGGQDLDQRNVSFPAHRASGLNSHLAKEHREVSWIGSCLFECPGS